jgi:uncharacterized protein (DUF1778 family)
MTAVARFDLKLDAEDKDLLSRAASLMGTTMAGFVRSAAKEKAQTLLEQESRVTLTNAIFLPSTQRSMVCSVRIRRCRVR